MTQLILNIGDRVEVRIVNNDRPTSRWVPMKVAKILYVPKSSIIREAFVTGVVDGKKREAWVYARYIRLPVVEEVTTP